MLAHDHGIQGGLVYAVPMFWAPSELQMMLFACGFILGTINDLRPITVSFRKASGFPQWTLTVAYDWLTYDQTHDPKNYGEPAEWLHAKVDELFHTRENGGHWWPDKKEMYLALAISQYMILAAWILSL